MRYDGPPGMMLDLVGPSPNGVDLEWTHSYTEAQPYRYSSRRWLSHPYTYAANNPVRYVDPSGLKEVCGIYVWLYTGLGWCVEENVYQAALDAAGHVVNCWWDCEVTIHSCVAGVAADVAGAAVPLTFTHLRVPKPPDLRVLGSGPVTTLQRILAERLREQGYEGIAARLHDRAALVNRAPLSQGLRLGAAGVAIVETGFSIYCGYKCS